jgi:hypothetical protein
MIKEEVAQGVAKDGVELETSRIFHQPVDQILQLTHCTFCTEQRKQNTERIKAMNDSKIIGNPNFRIGMHRILFLLDIRPAGYPGNPKAGYRISGKGRIPDIRSDTWLDNYIFGQISNKFIKTSLKSIDF